MSCYVVINAKPAAINQLMESMFTDGLVNNAASPYPPSQSPYQICEVCSSLKEAEAARKGEYAGFMIMEVNKEVNDVKNILKIDENDKTSKRIPANDILSITDVTKKAQRQFTKEKFATNTNYAVFAVDKDKPELTGKTMHELRREGTCEAPLKETYKSSELDQMNKYLIEQLNKNSPEPPDQHFIILKVIGEITKQEQVPLEKIKVPLEKIISVTEPHLGSKDFTLTFDEKEPTVKEIDPRGSPGYELEEKKPEHFVGPDESDSSSSDEELDEEKIPPPPPDEPPPPSPEEEKKKQDEEELKMLNYRYGLLAKEIQDMQMKVGKRRIENLTLDGVKGQITQYENNLQKILVPYLDRLEALKGSKEYQVEEEIKKVELSIKGCNSVISGLKDEAKTLLERSKQDYTPPPPGVVKK